MNVQAHNYWKNMYTLRGEVYNGKSKDARRKKVSEMYRAFDKQLEIST